MNSVHTVVQPSVDSSYHEGAIDKSHDLSFRHSVQAER
jgi:hypothetical protein